MEYKIRAYVNIPDDTLDSQIDTEDAIVAALETMIRERGWELTDYEIKSN